MSMLSTTIQERVGLPATARGSVEVGSATASDVLGMLRRRLVLVIVLFLLFSALALGGFALWWFKWPGYAAESLIECISNIPETEMTLAQQRLREDEHERFVQTQALLIKSPTILGEALKLTEVRQTDWYKNVKPNEQLLELTDDLRVAPVRGSNFLRASMECRNRKDAALIVNQIVDQWYAMIKRRASEEFASDPLEAAQKEINDLDRLITEKRDLLRRIAERLPAGARSAPETNVTVSNVRQFGEQVGQLTLELTQLDQFRSIYNDPAGVAVTAEDRARVEQDPHVAELARMLYLLQQQKAADEKVYGEGHSILRQLNAQISAAETRLSELRLEKYAELRRDMKEAANTAYRNSQYSLFVAQENLAKAEAALQDQDRVLLDYTTLETEITQHEEYKLLLDTYIKGLQRVRTQRSALNVHIAQRAIDPILRNSPNLLLLPVGLFLALALSMGITLGLEFMDKSIRTPQDIVRHMDVALLGVVPDTDDEEVAIARVETAILDNPRSMVAEAFRRIRTSLQYSAPPERQRTLLISGPSPGDGTTVVSCNLALAVAQSGRRVLLVDANFRRPTLKNVFPNIGATGLSNILIGENAMASCIVSSLTPNLDLLGSGPLPPNPAELLGNERCLEFLKEAASRYDQVIIDTPPLLLASDAMSLANRVDGVILVVRANQSSRGVARRAWTMLTDGGARVFGTVLNAAQVTRGGYFRKQLRAYYDYQPDAGPRGSVAPTKSS